MLAGRLDLPRNVGVVTQKPDRRPRANGDLPGAHRDPHRLLEIVVRQLQSTRPHPDNHQLARLICRDQQRGAQMLQDARQVERILVSHFARGLAL